jgi:hypothetical protein
MPDGLALADLTGDGRPDALVTDEQDSTVSIYINDGSGMFSLAGTPMAAGNQPDDVIVVDLDRDGALDLVVANESDNNVGVFYANCP